MNIFPENHLYGEGMEIMIDIHTHILPGIDDGAQDEQEAILMARAAVQEGIKPS